MEDEFLNYFHQCLSDPEISVPIASIKTLIHCIEKSKAETLSELRNNLVNVQQYLKESADNSVTSITSGCELLLRFITLAASDDLLAKDFSDCKNVLVERGYEFLEKVQSSSKKIFPLAQQFIQDESVILIHAKSRIVMKLLIEASKQGKRIIVYVTESLPDGQGYDALKVLSENGISCHVILDSAVGFIMERVNLVLLGAEAVVESGGIINKIGSFQISVLAKAMNKPVYVAVESFKFVREYPLRQKELGNKFKYFDENDEGHPCIDYTPPMYIALLLTDLGVLTPSAVSDELIKLYL